MPITSQKNLTYDKLSIAKTSNQDHESNKFIADYGATPNKVN